MSDTPDIRYFGTNDAGDAKDGILPPGTKRSIGWEGMDTVVSEVAKSAMGMKDTYDANIMPMYHVFNVKVGADGTKAGGSMIIAMDDRKVWLPTAMMMHVRHGGAEWAAHVSDAYMRFYDLSKEDPQPDLPLGALERNFKEGDMQVRECMVVTLRFEDGREFGVQLPYHLDDHGELEWDEPEWVAVGEHDHRDHGFVSHCLGVLMGQERPTVAEVREVMVMSSDIKAHKVGEVGGDGVSTTD